MGVEVVLDQDDLLGFGEVLLGQIAQVVSIVDTRFGFSHANMTPSFQWSTEHKQGGHPVALIFVVKTPGPSGTQRQRRSSFPGKLLGRFIQTNQGTLRIAGPLVDGKDVFHAADKLGLVFGRDTPLLFQPRFNFVFFSV